MTFQCKIDQTFMLKNVLFVHSPHVTFLQVLFLLVCEKLFVLQLFTSTGT